MTISELIAYVGNENVEIQNLRANFKAARIEGRNGTITFLTAPARVLDLEKDAKEEEFLGLVVWLPRERLPEELKNR